MTVAGGGSSAIGSNAGCFSLCFVAIFVVVGIDGVGFGGGCSSSLIPSSVSSSVTVSTTGTPPLPRSRTGDIVVDFNVGTMLGVTPTSSVDFGSDPGVVLTFG